MVMSSSAGIGILLFLGGAVVLILNNLIMTSFPLMAGNGILAGIVSMALFALGVLLIAVDP